MNTNDQDETKAVGDPGHWRLLASQAADGEASNQEVDGLLAQLRQDGPGRQEVLSAWHSYQLIGDVMRSEDLAGSGRDRSFMQSFRERLAQEPIVIAPAVVQPAGGVAAGGPSEAVVRRRPRLAAGIATVAVAGVLAAYLGLGDGRGVGGGGGAQPSGAVLVEAPAAPAAVTLVQAPVAAPTVESDTLQLVVTPSGQMLRDAALDQYLQAHSQFGGSSALQLPAGFMRGATAPSSSPR